MNKTNYSIMPGFKDPNPNYFITSSQHYFNPNKKCWRETMLRNWELKILVESTFEKSFIYFSTDCKS